MNLTLIDGNSIGYACHYATVLKQGNLQTQACFGMVRTLIQLREQHPESALLVLWDGRAQWRFEECPQYKSNRHSDDPKKEAVKLAYKEIVPYIQKILGAMGVRQLLCTTHEADDLAGLIVSKKKPEDRITLVTGDRDWLQLVRPNVIWKDPIRDKLIFYTSFFENRVVDYAKGSLTGSWGDVWGKALEAQGK